MVETKHSHFKWVREWVWLNFMGNKLKLFALWRCYQTNEPKHQYSFYVYFYEINNEHHRMRAASRLILNVLRFESDL